MSLVKKVAPLKYARSDMDGVIDFLNTLTFNVKEASYGARGDNTGDDGPPIQAALNAAEAAGGGVVQMPPGKYRLASPLTIRNGVTLEGSGWSWGGQGTYLHVVNTPSMMANSAITVTGDGVRLRNLAIEHDQPAPAGGWTPASYPFAIKCAAVFPALANDIEISDILLLNANKGILLGDAAANIAVGRILLDRISGQPLSVGIQIDYSLDVLRMSHVHFWPFWSQDTNVTLYQRSFAKALVLQHVDGMTMDDFFCIFYNTGLHFTDTAIGRAQRILSNNLYLDVVGGSGILVDGTFRTAQFINTTITGAAGIGTNNALVVTGDGSQIQCANFYVAGMGRRVIYIGAAARVDVTNFRAEVWSLETPTSTYPAIEVANANALVTLDAGATFNRSSFGFTTPAGAPDIGGPGKVIRLGIQASARVYRTTPQSIPQNVNTAISFDAERNDLPGWHDPANPTRLTAAVSGTFLVGCCVEWAASGLAGGRYTSIKFGGTLNLASQGGGLGGSESIVHQVNTQVYMNAGEYVEIVVFQSTGGPLNVLADIAQSPEAWLSKIGE